MIYYFRLGFILLLFTVTGCTNNPKVLIKTKYGSIVCEIYEKKAPVTARNFLKYVDEGRFDGATFYRTVTMHNQPADKVKIEVLQGGLFDEFHPAHLPPIRHEVTNQTGILHKDGVISMARSEPGTAQADFFICIGDQPELDYGGSRNPDGQGFAAFGKVVSGKEVVHKIHKLNNTRQYINKPVLIEAVERLN